MRYKRLGKSGLNVSEFCLGTWGFGGVGWDNYNEETRTDAIAAAVECGVNFIDTANAYNAGESERIIGRAFKKLGCRDKFIISTKCGNRFTDGIKYVRAGKRSEIFEDCESSLKNLQTDHIDLYLIHWPDPNVSFEETFTAMADLKKQGKVLHVGCSNFSKEQIEEASQYCPIEVLQPHYSMVVRGSEDLMKWCHENDIGNMTYGSLGGGILTGRYRQAQQFVETDSRNRFYKFFHEPSFSEVMKLLAVCEEIAAEHDKPVAQVALNWSAQKEFVSTCIVGAQTRDKILQNCAAFEWNLTEEEIAKLDAAIAVYEDTVAKF